MGNIFSIRILFRNIFFIIYFVMCRRRALCSLSFFIVLILGGIFYGKKCWISNRTEKKWKMAISLLFAWKKRDSVSKSGFATKAEAKAEGEKVRMGMLEGRLTYQGA